MEFQSLKKELDKGERLNFYIFTGEEREVMLKYINRIDPKAQSAPSFKSIMVRLQNKGLFTIEQTFVIQGDKDILQMDIKDVLKKIGKNRVILIFESIDKRMKFFKNTQMFTFEFNRFTESQLVNHVTKLIDVDDDLAMMIAQYCGNDVARIENECHKLNHLGSFDSTPWDIDSKDLPFFNAEKDYVKPKITFENIQELIVPPLEDQIFEMIDSIMKKKPKRVFDIYQDLIEAKESPIKVISILYTKFKQVFLIQSMSQFNDKDIGQKIGLNPYIVGKSRELIGHFELEELLTFLRAIQKTEVEMKTGKIDIDLGMNNLMINILM